MKPKVFLTRSLPEQVMKRLQAETELEMNTEERALTKEEIIAGIQGKDALLCLLTDHIDARVMDANPNLKVIANYAVGYNNIDLEAASERGIAVTNTPGVLTESSADLAFALIISLARRIAEADHYIRSEKWPGWEPSQFLGADVYGATLGIIGLGRIGKALAKRGKGFDMNVIYWNRTRLSEEEEHTLGLTYRPMDEVLAQADFVSLHVAYTPDTHHLINKAAFSKMKDSGFIINTARGAVIDEQALVDALKSKEIAGAGLDVFEEEPKIHPDLLTMNNTVLLPHIGSASVTTRTKMGMIAVDNILAGCKGQKIPNQVN